MKEKKGMRFEIKAITEAGTFEGLLSPYGNVDGGLDIVLPGAFTKTLKDQGNTRPLLWQHDKKEPIGMLTLEDRADGLWCKGQLLMEDAVAQRAYRFIKAGIVKGLSVGFVSVKDAIEGGIRKLSEMKLYEGSIVTFPMNEMALITSVKSRGEQKGDFNEELTERQLSDAGYQMRDALCRALASAFWSGLSKEEVIAASAMIIDQFRAAYMDYLPSYIDMMVEYYGDLETWHAKQRLETKSGRMISAANRTKLQSIADTISALLTEEAGDDTATSEAKAAKLNGQSEPVNHHSEVLTNLIALIPK